MIGDGENLGSWVLDCWVFGCLIFFFFFVGFGCDCGLWLKWWFGGCVGGGLVAMVMVVKGYVGLWLWLCWWWFDFFFLAMGCGCHIKVVVSGVVVEVDVAS